MRAPAWCLGAKCAPVCVSATWCTPSTADPPRLAQCRQEFCVTAYAAGMPTSASFAYAVVPGNNPTQDVFKFWGEGHSAIEIAAMPGTECRAATTHDVAWAGMGRPSFARLKCTDPGLALCLRRNSACVTVTHDCHPNTITSRRCYPDQGTPATPTATTTIVRGSRSS